MTLSTLIRKRDTGNIATAIPATQLMTGAATLATIATVTVANPGQGKTTSQPKVGDGVLLVSPVEPTACQSTGLRIVASPPSASSPIARPVLRFGLRNGGGTILGQPHDSIADLLASLRERWQDEFTAAWRGSEQIYP